MLKCLGMNCYDICNLVLNGLEKVKKKKKENIEICLEFFIVIICYFKKLFKINC